MLETIAVILIIIWVAGLFLHLLGGFIHIVLVVAIILIAARFLTGKKGA